jgi:hypothetical protein
MTLKQYNNLKERIELNGIQERSGVSLGAWQGETLKDKINNLAELCTAQKIERLQAQGLNCEVNVINAQATVKEGKKYIKIDVGNSGFLMIDNEGNIFGIKSYGVINKKQYFGTVDTILSYYWGGYQPKKIS